ISKAVTFYDLGSAAGLKRLDEYFLSRSYISGYRASKDDITVHAAISKAPSEDYMNWCGWPLVPVSLWRDLLPSQRRQWLPHHNASAAEDDDDDIDLFREETEQEKKASEERAASIDKKERSSVLLDVKP
ncbi:hypothetical protein G4B88_019544, partial [Cannabis sativa]